MQNSFIVASGHDNVLRYFQYSLGTPIKIHTVEGHQAWIRSLAYNEEFLASGSDDSSLKLWKINEKTSFLQQIHTVHATDTQKAYYWALTFLKPGVVAAGRGQNDHFSIRIWDFEGFQKNLTLYGHRNIVRDLCVVPCENAFISVSEDCTMKVWDLKSYKLRKTVYAHENAINLVVFNKMLGLVATSSSDFTLKIWVLRNLFKCLVVIEVIDKILCLKNFEKFGLIVMGSASGLLQGRNWIDGNIVFSININLGIQSLLCDEENQLIFTAESNGKVSVWQINNQ